MTFKYTKLAIFLLAAISVISIPVAFGEIADHVVINEVEFNASRDNYSDWLELYNPTDERVDLSGAYIYSLVLTNPDGGLRNAKIPIQGYEVNFSNGSFIQPGEFLIIKHPEEKDWLGHEGSQLHLSIGNKLVDIFPMGQVDLDRTNNTYTWQRISDGFDTTDKNMNDWKFTTGTPGKSNTIPSYDVPIFHIGDLVNSIVINEVEFNPASDEKSDWVELYNPTDEAVHLGDWYLYSSFNEGGYPYLEFFVDLPSIYLQPGIFFIITNPDNKNWLDENDSYLELSQGKHGEAPLEVYDIFPRGNEKLDTDNDSFTWQRITDGVFTTSESFVDWEFAESTRNNPNLVYPDPPILDYPGMPDPIVEDPIVEDPIVEDPIVEVYECNENTIAITTAFLERQITKVDIRVDGFVIKLKDAITNENNHFIKRYTESLERQVKTLSMYTTLLEITQTQPELFCIDPQVIIDKLLTK